MEWRLNVKSNSNWTTKDYEYLDESWGKVPLPNISKHLCRSENAVKAKVFKCKLGAFLDSGGYVSFNQLMAALGRGQSYSYQMISWVKERGLPVKNKRVNNNTWRIVYLEEFWKWAENNRTFIDFSKVEENILGKEPTWVKEQRRTDFTKATKYKNTPWTISEDKRLVGYLKQYRYGYHELSQMLGRTSGAIQRRLCDLGIKEHPLKADNHIEWKSEEYAKFAEMIKSGMSYDIMAEHLGRSSKALRGRTWEIYRTENLDKIISLMGNGGWGDGAPELTVKYDFRLAAVKNDMIRLCQLLLIRRNEVAFDGFWQKDMCMRWDDVKGCTAQENDCDSCVSFQRIREQYCARCGGGFFERKQNRFCAGCRHARKKSAQRKWARVNNKAG